MRNLIFPFLTVYFLFDVISIFFVVDVLLPVWQDHLPVAVM